jgi:hypothetical protein
MTHRSLPFTAVAGLSLSLLGGCGGAQAGGQTGEESEGRCTFAMAPLALDEESPLGFTPRAALSLAEGEHRAALRWVPTPNTPYGPESGEAEVRFTTSGAGSAQFAEVKPDQSATECRSSVRLAVTVALATSGGAFAESFPAQLVAEQAGSVELSQLLQPSTLSGSFAFEPQVLEDQRFIRVQVDAWFGAGGFAGAISAGLESGGGGGPDSSASFTAVPLACWGSVQGANAVACGM